MIPASASVVEPPASRRVLAVRGTGGYRQFRIPALAATSTVVVAAFDARPDLDDLPAPIDLIMRRSFDSGRTWEPATVVRQGRGFQGYGDPALIADPSTGKILMFHAAGEHAGFFESECGQDPDDPALQHCDLSISDDDGATWQHQRLTGQLRETGNSHLAEERIAGMFASSGAGCAVTAGPYAGRLVQPFVLRISGRIDVACGLSDDHGQTWRLAAPLRADLNESSVCMLPDGTLLLHSRGVGRRRAALSYDGGETFTPVQPVSDLLDPSVNGSVISVPGALLASHCDDDQLRRNATISRSTDGARTWHRLRVLEPGSAGYTQLAQLPDGRVGVLYEADGYQQIRFEAFELERPAPALPDRVDEGAGWIRQHGPHGLVLDLVLRSIIPARPLEWIEHGPTAIVDLSQFEHIDPFTFKEIGQDRGHDASQVLRTRESLAANLGPIEPGIRAGDRIEVYARLQNLGTESVQVSWDGTTSSLQPQQSWLRRDLGAEVTSEECARGYAETVAAVEVAGRTWQATLITRT